MRSRCPVSGWLVVAGSLAAGCSFDTGGIGGDVGDDAPVIDADPDADPPDSSIDGACGGTALTFTPANVDACAIPPAEGDVTFAPAIQYVIDTTTGEVIANGADLPGVAIALVTQTDGSSPAMVIAADDLIIQENAIVDVRGERPLVLVAYGQLRVDGVLDASGTLGLPGPGADRACATGAGSDGGPQLSTSLVPGGAGGGGGGFGTAGGDGAEVSLDADNPVTPGGLDNGADELEPLRGGCSGGDGGVAVGVIGAARGGGGGGGVQLVAGTEVIVTGVLTTSGGGGSGADVLAGGGGGGGSGGGILIQTPRLEITGGKITANGGGGGEGRRDTGDGDDGDDGVHDDDRAAAGGEGGGAGGNGGKGGVGSNKGDPGTLGTGSETATAGGGGGGGGVGRIRFRATTVDTGGGHKVSPQATTAAP